MTFRKLCYMPWVTIAVLVISPRPEHHFILFHFIMFLGSYTRHQ